MSNKLQQIETLLADLKKDLSIVDKSRDNIIKDIHKHSEQFKGAYKAAYVKIEMDSLDNKLKKLKIDITNQILKLSMMATKLKETKDERKED